MIKKRKIVIIIFSILLIAVLYQHAHPIYYDSSNKEYEYNRLKENEIFFSKPSGFYEEAFDLEIIAPSDEIYYTLDGSIPDQNSFRYTEPLRIEDASKNPNIYSSRTDTTTGFSEDLRLTYSSLNTRYASPADPVDKCTVIRAVYYNDKGERSDIQSGSYFIGFQSKSGYQNMNVISLLTEPDNLFGYENGIYVLGKTFDDFLESKLLDDPNYIWRTVWWWWPANYRQSGKEWERESCIQVFNKNKTLCLTQDVGIRIQGGGSRGYLPKSLNFYARNEYDGNDKLHYDFFHTNFLPKRVTLTAGGDDFIMKLKDPLVSELVEPLHIATMHYEPYILFLDGEYWGVYFLTEKYDEQYLSNYYAVNEENIVMIKNGEIEAGTEEDLESYKKTMEFLETADLAKAENYIKACQLMDMESLIDYFATEIFIARCSDWPVSNFALWKCRDTGSGLYEDGKWRWMLFDLNSGGMSEQYIETDSISYVRENSKMFDNLCNNKTFREAFASRLIELGNTVFLPEQVNSKINEYVLLMDEPLQKHYQRFFGEYKKDFKSAAEQLNYFFEQRYTHIIKSIVINFNDIDINKILMEG